MIDRKHIGDMLLKLIPKNLLSKFYNSSHKCFEKLEKSIYKRSKIFDNNISIFFQINSKNRKARVRAFNAFDFSIL